MSDSKESTSSSSKAGIEPANSEVVHVIEHGRDIHMYKITDIELDVLKSNYDSWSLGFCTLCLGGFIGFLIPLATIKLSDKMCAIFLSLTVVLFLLTIFFGTKWLIDRKEVKKRIKQIQERKL